MNGVIYDIWLANSFGSNTDEAISLLEEYGSSEAVYNVAAKNDKELKKAAEEYERCVDERVFVISYNEDIYPALLKETDNPPLVLYAKGDVSLLEKPLISIAGAKRCSHEGRINTKSFVTALSKASIVPVCGFSQGIEAEVCKTESKCIIILPCGIDETYPAKHYSLKNKIIKEGGLVLTMHPFGEKALPKNILARNRILAGISPYTFITEAGENSRTGIIFDNCIKYQRGCFAIPGSITSPYYMGNNSFLKKGAIVVTSPDDIINFYKYMYPDIITEANEDERATKSDFIDIKGFTPEEKAIIEVLIKGKESYDDLIEKSRLSANAAASAVTMLEMTGVIENEGGFFVVKTERI